jgi:hypothetical protein
MSVRRLRWQGERRRQQLLDRLRGELAAWLQQWSVNPTALALVVPDADGFRAGTGWRWIAASGVAGSVRFGAHPATSESLGALLAQASATDSLALGRRVGERALRALLSQLAGGGPAVDIATCDEPDEIEQEARFGGLGLRLHGTGFDALLWLDCALCEHWLPPMPTKAPALQSRESALGRERVTLDIVLDLGDATLADTRGLQVGDVLVSRAPLDSAFLLTSAGHRRLASVRLHRQGTLRALQIEST